MQAFLAWEVHQSWNQPTTLPLRLIKAFLWRPIRSISISCMHLNLYASNQEEVEAMLVVMTRWAAEENLSQQKRAADYQNPQEATRRLQRRFKFALFRTRCVQLSLSDDWNTLKEGILLGRSSSTHWCICALSSSIFTKSHSPAFTSGHAQLCMFI